MVKNDSDTSLKSDSPDDGHPADQHTQDEAASLSNTILDQHLSGLSASQAQAQQTLAVQRAQLLAQDPHEREEYFNQLRRSLQPRPNSSRMTPVGTSNKLSSKTKNADQPQSQIEADEAFARELDIQLNLEPFLPELSKNETVALDLDNQGPKLASEKAADPEGAPYGWSQAARERLATWEDRKDASGIKFADALVWENLAKSNYSAGVDAAPSPSTSDKALAQEVEQRLAVERDAQAARDLAEELDGAKSSKQGKNEGDDWQDFADSEDELKEEEDESSDSDDDDGGVPL